MWESLTRPWHVCISEAWAAYRAGAIPIGAAIVNERGEVVAQGRNQTAGAQGAGVLHHTELAHAELNALLAANIYRDLDVHNWELYSSLEPCPLCFGAFFMSGIRTLHYAARDPYAGSTNLLGATPYLTRKPIRLHHPQDELLEIIILGLNFESFLGRYDELRESNFYKVTKATVPRGVALAEHWYREGSLRALCQQGADAPEMLAWARAQALQLG